MDPATHDRAVAAISHLPHLVVDALVAAVVDMDPRFLDVAARGFKDTTRIAASDPAVWREIFQQNREALAEAIAAFRGALGQLEGILASGRRCRHRIEPWKRSADAGRARVSQRGRNARSRDVL